jgi:hypothetical protein
LKHSKSLSLEFEAIYLTLLDVEQLILLHGFCDVIFIYIKNEKFTIYNFLKIILHIYNLQKECDLRGVYKIFKWGL